MPRTILPHAVPTHIAEPIARAVARTGITPNGITAIGFVGNLIAAWLAADGRWLAAGLVMLVGSGLDLLDGALARATGRATRFGAIFDAVLDRYSEAAVLFGLLVYFESRESYVQVGLTYVALAGSVLVSLVRARAEIDGMRLREGLFTRAERVVLTAVALIIGQWAPVAVTVALWILAVLASLTAIQRVYYTWKLGQQSSV
ncbi:MAG: CDP-alcohol phosphatidyltransferase family protein [Dehalococcoidia bacterium]